MKKTSSLQTIVLAAGIVVIVIASALGGAVADRLFIIKPLDFFLGKTRTAAVIGQPSQTMVQDESAVVSVAEKVSPSVLTVSITKQQTIQRGSPYMGFYDPFGMFGFQMPESDAGQSKEIKQDIGSGFVVDKSGLIVTNKHVVSDTRAKYRIVTKDNKEYEVKKVYRDPSNDLAILQVDAQLPPVELGDSSQLKVGQFAIAIGTALGEFRHTVTTGVISGLGRGITAGTGYGTFAEKLDDVIQTDAAINPGNSGGPLLNSSGQVIGVNVAVAQGAQNVGFAIPINVVKESLKNFEATGKFSRPFVGVRYRLIPKETALLNDVAAGAYLVEIVPNSSAAKAGLEVGDILTKFDSVDLTTGDTDTSISKIIEKKKVGDQVKVEFVRDGKKQELTITLQESEE